MKKRKFGWHGCDGLEAPSVVVHAALLTSRGLNGKKKQVAETMAIRHDSL